MEVGHFYYLEDQYFIDFSDPMLMKNKEVVDGQVHDRPCYYTFQDTKTNLYWMIPISSKVEKYSVIYDRKINKYGKCDTIAFGEVLGHKKAFLIQNMCPFRKSIVRCFAKMRKEHFSKLFGNLLSVFGSDFQRDIFEAQPL